MTTRKTTKKTASSKRGYINYTPSLKYIDRYKEAHLVPYVIYGEKSKEPMYDDYLMDRAYFGLVRDRRGMRQLNEFDFIDKKLPRHYEVSVPKATYDRALKKIDKIAALRDKADRIRGIYGGIDRPFNYREAGFEVMADLARKTRARRKRTGLSSLRYRH